MSINVKAAQERMAAIQANDARVSAMVEAKVEALVEQKVNDILLDVIGSPSFQSSLSTTVSKALASIEDELAALEGEDLLPMELLKSVDDIPAPEAPGADDESDDDEEKGD